MAHVHVQTAAELTRRHRSTITRAIKEGRVSATRGADGRYLIDPAELERVFGKLAPAGVHARARTGVRTHMHGDAAHRGSTADGSADGQPGEASLLAREVELLREQLERERTERARERHVFDEERRFLRGLIEEQTEHIRLLNPPSPARRRWWFW